MKRCCYLMFHSWIESRRKRTRLLRNAEVQVDGSHRCHIFALHAANKRVFDPTVAFNDVRTMVAHVRELICHEVHSS